MPGRIQQLRALPLFAELPGPSLERIAAMATEVELRPGQVLIQPNAAGSGMYVLQDGTVTVELRGRTIELGPGEFFGELSLLVPDATRSARVRAATPVRCLALSRADFEALLESEPALAVSMLRTLARRLLKEIGAYESD